jgi:hypothetical protein
MSMNFIILQDHSMSFSMELIITGILMLVLFWLYHTLFVKPQMHVKHSERKKTVENSKATELNLNDESSVSDEVSAVIGLALHLYKKQLSDYEKARLTIARVSRTYSPWSSKIYGLRQNPRK